MMGFIKIFSQLVQVVAVIAGVVISVRTFAETQRRASEARTEEARRQAIEAQKYREQRDAEARHPYVELRQKLYLDAIHSAAILADPSLHDAREVASARARFWELYWGELSLVEGQGVEKAMMELGAVLDADNRRPTPAQAKTYDLAHRLRDSLKKTWGINEPIEPETP
jgi:hypothetical protein